MSDNPISNALRVLAEHGRIVPLTITELRAFMTGEPFRALEVSIEFVTAAIEKRLWPGGFVILHVLPDEIVE